MTLFFCIALLVSLALGMFAINQFLGIATLLVYSGLAAAAADRWRGGR